MSINTSFCATIGGLSLLAGTSVSTLSRAELGSFLGIGEGLEDFILATDAYIYGYPLVTMEMTRRVITNVAEPVGTRGPMGQIIKLRQYPDASFRDVTAPNADTLYTTVVLRCRQGAVGAEHPRHEGPLLSVSDAGRLDDGVPGAGQAHHRARARRPTRSPDRAGTGTLPPGSRNTSRRPTSSGCSAASTAPARRRTMPPSTSCRTSSSWCR